MSSVRFTKRSALAATAAVTLALAVPFAAGQPAGAATRHNLSFAGHKTVIVYLKGRGALPAKPGQRATAARAAQAPIRSQLTRAGATHVTSLSSVDAVIATVSSSGAQALAANPNVKRVVPDSTIPGPLPSVQEPTGAKRTTHSLLSPAVTPPPCGTSANPEIDPEALEAIHATPSDLNGIDGRGVSVAYMADGIDPTNPDFQRNSAYSSSVSPAGSPVVDSLDFTGDGTSAVTAGGEAFEDAGSMVAQGNVTYDLHDYGPETPAAGCDIKIVGASPGAHVTGMKVFAENNATTDSDFLQAIDYAVTHHVKVLNESFGGNDFPDTSQDVVRDADNAAIKAGVTVVASSGDAGITNTIGTPAIGRKLIAAGASTTYREYEQEGYGGTNVPGANGKWVNNNVSALSSGGFGQNGKTVDILAPGDLNWGLCSPDDTTYLDCDNDNGDPTGFTSTGGTSESAPLTSAAAADVIQAYASTHAGKDPSPALIKHILMSTATDVAAPAEQGGAGLLNVKAAIQEAKSLPGTTSAGTGGLLITPNQINTEQKPGATTTKTVTVTNTGAAAETVHLSTRALTKTLASHSGSFCLQPGHPTKKCPANTGTFNRETGAMQVYQAVPFTVPATTGSEPSRLVFDTAYLNTGQNSVLKVALLEPDGTYASYSEPQGQGDFADNEVANPPAGQWTAIFFTTKSDAASGVVGTSGKIQWNVTTEQFVPASTIKPASLSIPAGKTKTATVTLTAPAAAGDTAQSIVVAGTGTTTTVPVTQRTLIRTNNSGGHFHGVLTGGNGRMGTSRESAFDIDVPKGTPTLQTSVRLKDDAGDTVFGGLIDPNGQIVSYSSNATADSLGGPAQTKGLDLYSAAPMPGRWRVLLRFADPVTGKELKEPFTGDISFKTTGIRDNLPSSAKTVLKRGKATSFAIHLANHGAAPQAFFADPRSTKSGVATLPNLNPTENGKVILPMDAGYSQEPTYVIPPHTSKFAAKVKADGPVNFSMYPGLGFNPDIAPGVGIPGVTGTVGTNSATLGFAEPQITPGIWFLDPSEIGPFGSGPAPTENATVGLKAKLQLFDPAVTSTQGDYWEAIEGLAPSFRPRYIPVHDSSVLRLTVKPTAKPGTTVHGVVYVDAITLYAPTATSGNQVAAIPYSYTVKK